MSDTAPLLWLVGTGSIAVALVLLASFISFGGTGMLAPRPEASAQEVLAGLAAELTDAPGVRFTGPFGVDMDRSLRARPGFSLELVYAVPREQGSWVSVAIDDRGRLIASDQSAGLYRITPSLPGQDASTTRVEPMDSPAGAAQGLLCLGRDLYCVVAGPRAEGEGLYRLRDTDGDDTYDDLRLLRRLGNGGEHGPHGVVEGPDGMLYVVAGNHTPIPDPERSLIPRRWGEDHLLPRLWDANGHAVNIMAPGGWVCRTDRDGAAWELFAAGFRNPYDIAFDRDGELFTFDADMEWDMGAPWYRPTRIIHVTSGADFGWRSGTVKWPAYYHDSLPATLDIGPGSPTGVCFGYGTGFPPRYRDALYALDWTFGTVYAIRLEPDGASFRAVKEPLITGRPFPVADAVVNPLDRAMYFVLGGRGTASAIYRLRWVGAAPDDDPRRAREPDARRLRRELEALHRRAAGAEAAVSEAWPHLGSRDRFVAAAARIAIEHRPPATWVDRALREPDDRARLNALAAVARCATPEVQGGVIDALESVRWSDLAPDERLQWLRCWKLCFIRLGAPGPDVAQRVAARFERLYPTDDDFENRELCDLLVYLGSPTVVARTIPLMEQADRRRPPAPDPDLVARNDSFGSAILKMAAAMPQQQQVHYALALAFAERGWTPGLRSRYFAWFESAGRTRGGNSFAGFLSGIRAEALERVPESQRAAANGSSSVFDAGMLEGLPVAEGPGRAWTVDEVVSLASAQLSARDFENGRRMYEAAMCAQCHRFAGTGRAGGPDLTSVASRYTVHDLVQSIVEPSRVVSDQYRQTEIVLHDGSVVVGTVVDDNGSVVTVLPTLLARDTTVDVRRENIASRRPSALSPMMPALLDPLNADEVMDLIAYLLGEGDARNPIFAARPGQRIP